MKMKHRAFAIRGKEIVSELGIPPDIDASNIDEWVESQKQIAGYDCVVIINDEDFKRLFW